MNIRNDWAQLAKCEDSEKSEAINFTRKKKGGKRQE
jgi:hypothetical protein